MLEELAVAVSRALGSRPVSFAPRAGGYSTADRYAVELAAGLPPPETAPMVREIQRRQLAVTLDWVDRELP